MRRIVGVIVDRRDSADGLSVVHGQKQPHVGVLEERALFLIETVALAHPQRRHPIRMVAILSIRKIDELCQRSAVGDLTNFDHDEPLTVSYVVSGFSRTLDDDLALSGG